MKKEIHYDGDPPKMWVHVKPPGGADAEVTEVSEIPRIGKIVKVNVPRQTPYRQDVLTVRTGADPQEALTTLLSALATGGFVSMDTPDRTATIYASHFKCPEAPAATAPESRIDWRGRWNEAMTLYLWFEDARCFQGPQFSDYKGGGAWFAAHFTYKGKNVEAGGAGHQMTRRLPSSGTTAVEKRRRSLEAILIRWRVKYLREPPKRARPANS